ncbi:SDR family NAD(P)-dependent oxidoreductase [Actinoallomurus sp. NPDC050550]|uniref:SDR family NAD(P)-dependent oxidoreductase n=1 Tax=Actinoallomurus sp. NPDC050550 TaxID=3154937 RepID=UPI0033CC666E
MRTATRDLSSLAQVRRLAEEVLARYDRLDVLVNNAGVIMMRRQLTADGLETTFTGADTPVYLACSPEVADVTGGYFVKRKPAEPSALARDARAAMRLWALSEELAGLAPGR